VPLAAREYKQWAFGSGGAQQQNASWFAWSVANSSEKTYSAAAWLQLPSPQTTGAGSRLLLYQRHLPIFVLSQEPQKADCFAKRLLITSLFDSRNLPCWLCNIRCTFQNPAKPVELSRLGEGGRGRVSATNAGAECRNSWGGSRSEDLAMLWHGLIDRILQWS
jgi:hypothetical protein